MPHASAMDSAPKPPTIVSSNIDFHDSGRGLVIGVAYRRPRMAASWQVFLCSDVRTLAGCRQWRRYFRCRPGADFGHRQLSGNTESALVFTARSRHSKNRYLLLPRTRYAHMCFTVGGEMELNGSPCKFVSPQFFAHRFTKGIARYV